MEVKKVQNPIVPKSIQDDLNVKNIVDVLAKLRTVNSSLEQESSKKEKMKKESFEKGREVVGISRFRFKVYLVKGIEE